MENLMQQLKIVILDCPYDTWDSQLTQNLFNKMVSLKLQGYSREYDYGVLPLDTSDFIATHLMICIEKDGDYQPLMAYRSVSLDRCRIHRIGLPVHNLMKQLGATQHDQAIAQIIENCDKEKKSICYASSLAVHNDYKGSKELKDLLKTINVYHTQDYGISEILAGGALRFKMDQFYHFMGYEDLSFKGEVLPPLAIPFALNEMTGFYHLKGFSEMAKAVAKNHKAVWDSRLEINSTTMNKKIKIAA